MEQYNQPAPNTSGTNTTLLVIILLILVGVGVWWFSTHKQGAAPADNSGIQVDVNIPSSSDTSSTENQDGMNTQ